MSISHNRCGAVILAGGLSRRMGRCKAMLPVDGQTMLLRTRGELSDFETVLVSCNEPALAAGHRAVADYYPGCGPLAGIHAALTAADCEALFTVPCDLPNFSRELPRLLLSEMDDETDVLICRDSRGDLHPLCGIYRKRVLPILENCLQNGQFRVMNFVHQVSFRVLSTEGRIPDDVFFNMNTPEDYRAATDGSGCREGK